MTPRTHNYAIDERDYTQDITQPDYVLTIVPFTQSTRADASMTYAIVISPNAPMFEHRYPYVADFCATFDAALTRAEHFLYTSAPEYHDTSWPPMMMQLRNAPRAVITSTHVAADGRTIETRRYERQSFTNPKSQPAQTKIKLSQRAWDNLNTYAARLDYLGKSQFTGLSHYLIALLKANPSPRDWSDTRPEDLTVLDAGRLAYTASELEFSDLPHRSGVPRAHFTAQLPIWTTDPLLLDDDTTRKHRSIREDHVIILSDLAAPIVTHFLITSGRAAVTPRSQMGAMIEAIGLGYLTPRRQPQPNPKPLNPKRRKYQRPFELNF